MIDFTNSLTGRPNTIKTLVCLYNRWIKPHLPPDPNMIDLDYVESRVKSWNSEGLKPNTIRSLISLLRRYVRNQTGRDLNTSSITKKVSRMEIPTPVKAWTKDQADRALKEAKSLYPELYEIMVVTLHTGIRKGELFGLKWGDIDILSGKINVIRSYDGPTKNGKPRTIRMTKEVERILNERYTPGREDKFCFERWDPNPRLESLCREAGVPVLTWHGLRHTFATLALEANKSPRIVAAILGHSNVSTTLNLYWSLTSEEMDMGFIE